MKNAFYSKKIIEKLNCKKFIELYNLIIQLNKYYSTKDFSYFPKISKSNKNAFEKAQKKGNLFLGMYPHYEWLDQMVDIYLFNKQNNTPIENDSSNKSNDNSINNSDDIEILDNEKKFTKKN